MLKVIVTFILDTEECEINPMASIGFIFLSSVIYKHHIFV